MTAEVSIEPQKNTKSHVVSILFLITSILISLGLFIYNMYLVSDSDALKTQIKAIESNVSELEKDKTLSIFSLLQTNKKTIDQLTARSKITVYMDHMKYISTLYDVDFVGFNISGTTINTTVAVMSDDRGLAYKKTSTFIEKYRNDPKALFNLSFVDRFSGYDDMRFNATFSIK